MGARYFALIAGILYTLVGLMGFIPGMVMTPGTGPDIAVDAGYGYLLGLFPVNVLHNIVHLAVGILGLLSYRSMGSARSFSRGLAIFYGVLAVMGLIPVLNITFGLIPIFSHDVWLHALTAAIAAYFGFSKPKRESTAHYDSRSTVGSRDRY
ncbi:MAG TPA: DUF4383 domain-containing protein [Leptolyngbyaceae cyanobacterium]